VSLDIPQKLFQIIEKFEKIDSQSLKESKLKSDFIEPFFQILGWNLKSGKTESLLEPEIRKLNKINEYYPDYLLKAVNENQFYLKIVNPENIDIKNSPEFTMLHRNCWTSNIPGGILTDFHSIYIYDLHTKPGSKTKLLFSCNCQEYVEKWEIIYNLVSKEAVQNGSLKKFQRETLNSVYYYFANELLDWHSSLTFEIKTNFPGFSDSEIDIISTRLINRLLLLRFCESLGLEPVNQLKSTLDKNNIYKSLLNLFEKANEKYNSGLFYFQQETGRNVDSLDLISFKIDVDNKVLIRIINQFYSDDQAINYCTISVDTIATAFDIYIKHVIDKSNNDSISNEYLNNYSAVEKNALIELTIRKSHTEFLEGKKPGRRSSVTSTKILDPCCGSGLYLLKSFEFLINWHLKEYLKIKESEDSSNDNLPIKKMGDGHWHLSWEAKKQILINNIYGVDINRIAVESAELILLLKLLEDISPKNIQDQLKLFWQHALPDLGENIKCGNALIESDIYKLQQFVATNEKQKLTINAFDWHQEFKRFNPVENFDIIIGHPPLYFSEFFVQKTKPYFKQRYNHFKDFKNSYLLFYEKSLKLMKKNGILAFIVPEDWLSNSESFNILKSYWIKDVYKLRSGSKSKNKPERLVTIIKKQSAGETNVYVIKNLNFEKPSKSHHFKFINYININYFFGYFEKYLDSDLNNKIETNSIPLRNLATSFSGYNAYEKGKGLAPDGGVQTKETLKSKPYHSDTRLNEQWKTEIVGRDISRYCLKFTGMRWTKYGPWLAAPRDPEIFDGERILLHERISIINGRIESSICSNEVFHGRDIIAIKPKAEFPNIFYLLGILNSKLFNWYYLVNYSAKSDEAFPKLLVANLNDSPIKHINIENLRDKNTFQELTSLVKRNLELNQKILEVPSERDRITMDKMICNIDKEIDEAVYKLYDLSIVEIEMIENSFNT
jgi:Eco57I restriction-modification methylase/restriction endonuclease TaqI-like protein